MSKACDQSGSHRISRNGNNNWDCTRCLLSGLRRKRLNRNDDIRIYSNKLVSERTKTLKSTLRVPGLDADSLYLQSIQDRAARAGMRLFELRQRHRSCELERPPSIYGRVISSARIAPE